MRYPNTRYGNPEELRYYSQGLTVKIIAKKLKRSEKSISAWLNGDRKIPFWVPELLRLWHMERDLTMRQMGFGDQKLKLGLVSGRIIEFKRPQALGIAQPTAQAPHHPSQPHSCSVNSQMQSTLNLDEEIDQYRTIGLYRHL